jgi:hypothetical protein
MGQLGCVCVWVCVVGGLDEFLGAQGTALVLQGRLYGVGKGVRTILMGVGLPQRFVCVVCSLGVACSARDGGHAGWRGTGMTGTRLGSWITRVHRVWRGTEHTWMEPVSWIFEGSPGLAGHRFYMDWAGCVGSEGTLGLAGHGFYVDWAGPVDSECSAGLAVEADLVGFMGRHRLSRVGRFHR